MRTVRLNGLVACIAVLLIAALAACGGSAKATATPAASATPTAAANRVQATQLVASASPATATTPTPLANILPSSTANSTEAARATGGPTTAAINVVTPTPLARTTVVTSVVATNTPASGLTARSTQPSGSATTTAATSGSATTGTAGPPTTTPVPVTEARGTVEQFLRTVLGKGDVSGYLTPAFKSQASGDGYKLLNIQPPVQEFTVDSEQPDADGNGATVRATITTASGVVKRGFVMRKQGSSWLVDNIVS
ncbi:MAG: hypothetical protein ACR2JW_10010 [Thermomicrobiales bacterium]